MQAAFTASTGCALRATFSAVGVMQQKLLAGEPCDVVILTAALIEALARDHHVVAETVVTLGAVPTGVAVRKGDAWPDVSGGDALRRSLLAASGIYVPDTERSTAGIHVMKVLRLLGIDAEVAPSRLRTYPKWRRRRSLELSRIGTRTPADRHHAGQRDHRHAGGRSGGAVAERLRAGNGLFGRGVHARARRRARAALRAAARKFGRRCGARPRRVRVTYSCCNALRISRNFALTRASLSGPIRSSAFCPAERSSNAGSANSYSTLGCASAIGPLMSGVASR